ncbi:SsgA family sporulation/cell division regulator [Streptomyces sp. KL118A]|uniref:SsgA family sporulation/cell division regulator n=1 Tax=Streptomyces sp. KL118A TaxID=3045153 RepID=UPI00278BC0C0|nr:SsgA family sporulation/cell division regulator [Streptomyces sp. KL118A]
MSGTTTHAVFMGHRTAPGERPVAVLVTASCSPHQPWFVRLCCIDEQACETTRWSFSRGALFDGLTNPVVSEGVTLQPVGFALLFSLNGSRTRRFLVQLDRAEFASFLVRVCLSDA